VEITEQIIPVELFFPPRPNAAERSTGIHVSDVIRDISNRLIHKGQRRPMDDMSSAEIRRMGSYVHGGFAWEEIIRTAIVSMYREDTERFVIPGEFELGGIYGTPDWFDTVDWVLEEFKCTWKSSYQGVDTGRFWEWFCQIKAYSWMMGVTKARLRVYFVNGDYRESGPQVKTFLLEFTDAELKQNWQMLETHARAMQEK